MKRSLLAAAVALAGAASGVFLFPGLRRVEVSVRLRPGTATAVRLELSPEGTEEVAHRLDLDLTSAAARLPWQLHLPRGVYRLTGTVRCPDEATRRLAASRRSVEEDAVWVVDPGAACVEGPG